jgi:hypothetical protein
MKKLLPFLVASILPALPALAEPNLGDWANRHRLADNLCKLGDHEPRRLGQPSPVSGQPLQTGGPRGGNQTVRVRFEGTTALPGKKTS